MNTEESKTEYDMNSTHKSFSGPKHGCFHELKQEISEVVHLKRKTGVPITHKMMKYRVQELAKPHNFLYHLFKAIIVWCIHMMQSNRFSRHRTLLCQKLPADFEEKSAALWQDVTSNK